MSVLLPDMIRASGKFLQNEVGKLRRIQKVVMYVKELYVDKETDLGNRGRWKRSMRVGPEVSVPYARN